MGALGLPGDLSSQSRFVRVAFVKLNSVSGDSEEESVSPSSSIILGSIDQQKGCSDLGNGNFEMTLYTSAVMGIRILLLHHLWKPSDHCRGYAPGEDLKGNSNSVSPCTEGADPDQN